MSKNRRSIVNPYPTEEQESIKLASWARMMVETGQEPRLMMLRCGFEGLRLSMGLRMKVKRQSIIQGWPDWTLYVTKKVLGHFPEIYGYITGLCIELKRVEGGVVSDEQKEIHSLLREQGYQVEVCYGVDQAIAAINKYLGR